MARTTIDELKQSRLNAITANECAIFDATCQATRLALVVGEKLRGAREAADLSQRELAARVGTSQASIVRLEAGDVEMSQRWHEAGHPGDLGTIVYQGAGRSCNQSR